MVDLSFKVSENQTERVEQARALEYGLPLLLDSLKMWAGKGNKPNMTRGFIHDLDEAFGKAEGLGMMGMVQVSELHRNYIAFRQQAGRPPAKSDEPL